MSRAELTIDTSTWFSTATASWACRSATDWLIVSRAALTSAFSASTPVWISEILARIVSRAGMIPSTFILMDRSNMAEFLIQEPDFFSDLIGTLYLCETMSNVNL